MPADGQPVVRSTFYTAIKTFTFLVHKFTAAWRRRFTGEPSAHVHQILYSHKLEFACRFTWMKVAHFGSALIFLAPT